MSTPELVQAHRADLDLLTELALKDLDQIWAQFTSADAARDGLMDVLPELLDVYGSAAATLGADWYDEVREMMQVPGRFVAVPAEQPKDRSWIDVLARWAVGPLFQKEPDWPAAKSLVDGGLEKAVQDLDRHTITEAVVEDKEAVGWKRVGHGSCAFCQMLIGRGLVYKEHSRFASHNNCKCSVVPAFGGQPEPVNPYTPSPRNITDADRARVREWLKKNPQT